MSRSIYKEAHRRLKNADEKEERLVLLEAWKDFEVRDHQICSNDFDQSIYAKTTAFLCSLFSVIASLKCSQTIEILQINFEKVDQRKDVLCTTFYQDKFSFWRGNQLASTNCIKYIIAKTFSN